MSTIHLPKAKDYLSKEGVLRFLESEHIYPFEKKMHEALKDFPNMYVGRQLFESVGQKIPSLQSTYYSTQADHLEDFLAFSNFGCVEKDMKLIEYDRANIRFKQRIKNTQYGKVVLGRASQNKHHDFVIVYHFGGEGDDVRNFLNIITDNVEA